MKPNLNKYFWPYLWYPCLILLLWFFYRVIGCKAMGLTYLCSQSLAVLMPLFGLFAYVMVFYFLVLTEKILYSTNLVKKKYIMYGVFIVSEVFFYLVLFGLFWSEYRAEYSMTMISVFLILMLVSFFVFRKAYPIRRSHVE